MREDQVCTTSEELVVEDDDLVERVEEWEAFAENSKKTFLRHLVNQVQAAGTVDVALTGEYEQMDESYFHIHIIQSFDRNS